MEKEDLVPTQASWEVVTRLGISLREYIISLENPRAKRKENHLRQ